MNRLIRFLQGGVFATILIANAHATIIGGNVTGGSAQGSFVELSVPFTESNPNNTVGNDNFQSDDLYGFNEGQNITLTSAINVDILASTASFGSLTVGTVVASHYIFFDPIRATIEATVSFDSAVLAIISSTENLAASDFLVNTGINYLNPDFRGLEDRYDNVSISNTNQVSLGWQASSPGDYVRVLTEASPAAAASPAVSIATVPEPGILGMLGLSLLLAALRKNNSSLA